MAKASPKTAKTFEMEEHGKVFLVKLESIEVPNRLRKVDDDLAAGIADSMAVNGQQSPIEVSSPDKDGKCRLITGAHRLKAASLNGWTAIQAVIFRGSENEARLREIDENLIRRELSPLDKATFLAERKRLYEELYPETKAGTAGANARWHAGAKFSFASSTAEKCGISERSIQLAIYRHNNIVPDVRERIALTWIAEKGTELDALAKLEPDHQRKAVELLLDPDPLLSKDEIPTSVTSAAKIIRGVRTKDQTTEDPSTEELQNFLRFWKNTSAKGQGMIAQHLVNIGVCAPVVS